MSYNTSTQSLCSSLMLCGSQVASSSEIQRLAYTLAIYNPCDDNAAAAGLRRQCKPARSTAKFLHFIVSMTTSPIHSILIPMTTSLSFESVSCISFLRPMQLCAERRGTTLRAPFYLYWYFHLNLHLYLYSPSAASAKRKLSAQPSIRAFRVSR